MSKRTALDRLYKLAKAEEEREKKLKQAERERQKKLKKKKQELITKLQIEFMESMYEKYLKISKKTSSEFTMLDFMAHIKHTNAHLISKERLNELKAKEDKLHEILQQQTSPLIDKVKEEKGIGVDYPTNPRCLSVSMVKSTTRTNIKHNNREMTEKEKAKHTYIDYTKSNENKYLVKKDIRALYHEEFDEVLAKYNAKQKQKNRRIADYYKHVKAGKRTALQHEIVVQIGDKESFESNIETKKDVNRILTQWFESFEKRNPQLKVCNAVIHNDEATPHIHINIVPVATGYKNGLEKQPSLEKALLAQNPNLNKKRPFMAWRTIEVNEIEKIMNEYGYICNKDKFNQVHTNPKS